MNYSFYGMTPEERQLVTDLFFNQISDEDFLKHFKSSDGRRLSLERLEEALRSQNGEDVGCAMTIGFTFGFIDEHLELLLPLAAAPWHSSHEDIISVIDRFRAPGAVQSLYQATQWVPDNLRYNNGESLAVKAIWALGNIRTPEAITALNQLTQHPNPVLSENAESQLERIANGEVLKRRTEHVRKDNSFWVAFSEKMRAKNASSRTDGGEQEPPR